MFSMLLDSCITSMKEHDKPNHEFIHVVPCASVGGNLNLLVDGSVFNLVHHLFKQSQVTQKTSLGAWASPIILSAKHHFSVSNDAMVLMPPVLSS